MQAAVCDENDLALVSHQHIDGIAQFDQGTGFSQEELYIIDDKYFDVAVFFAEAGKASGSCAFGVFDRELFTGQTHDASVSVHGFEPMSKPDGEVRLTDSVGAVD